ncbi:Tyrosine-protein phosphatase non-receptor type 11 [Trichinella nelsoni]|uniref:Tyrosine-protein phosphatase non-receptor type 11 n=1 Tax=Trichinella nelsoni TaxID=6336 RepID=A0A0V0RSD5_9BILA|nr:Tyrosine-protein phosphatase non-receptor type 11 [Trichinella nelsoni]
MIPDFAIRTLCLQKIVNDEAESRLVYHYQFLAWPDHGVPPNPGTVVNFLEEINQLESGMTDKRPLIVHCSAGIGRTGTFIAIDLILCLIRKYGLQCTIDIRRTVQMLRSQRSGMVQTEAQYKFVYMSVHYYIDTFAKLLHEHKRIEDTGHEYTNIRYSAEAASNQVIPISPSPFGSSMRPCNHPQCEACSSTPVVYQPEIIPPPRPKKVPRNPPCLARGLFSLDFCFMHTRFKWYNIRRSAVDPKQADPTYYENLALSVPLAQGYIDRLGEIWFEMVSVSRDVNFKRDDILIKHDSTHWLPHVDIKQPKAEYESVKALETAPDSVKKLFSIEFGRRKDLTFQWKRALMNKVRQNELDTSSLEVRIAKQTAFICHWSKLLSEMKSHLTSFIQEGKRHAFPNGKLQHFISPGQWPSFISGQYMLDSIFFESGSQCPLNISWKIESAWDVLNGDMKILNTYAEIPVFFIASDTCGCSIWTKACFTLVCKQ